MPTRHGALREKSRKVRAEALFSRGSRLQEEGNLRSAFRLLLNAAKLGNSAAQLNLGYTYDVGLGVKRNRDAAMYWYRRSYRNGYGWGAANNIATIFRDEKNYKWAVFWFQKAANPDYFDAYLEIAKIFLLDDSQKAKAARYLKLVLKGKPEINVGAEEQEEARLLLENLNRHRRRQPNKR